MGWCEENGKRPALSGTRFLWMHELDRDLDGIHKLPDEVYRNLCWHGRIGPGYRTFSDAVRDADLAALAAIEIKVRRQQWISLSHATAAKYSNHVRLATAGLDAS